MATRRPPDQRTLASLSRIRLLHELQQHGHKTVEELAAATGLHHNTAREHLHRLIETGFVSSETIPASSKGRPRIRYRAASEESDANAQERAAAAHRRTAQSRRQLPIGDLQQNRSAAELQLELLDDHMVQCGFDTEMDSEATATAPRMTMHDCPYADIARQDPQVCAVHFTLVQAALHRVDGPVTARALHPFSGPSACTVDLTIGDPIGDTDPR